MGHPCGIMQASGSPRSQHLWKKHSPPRDTFWLPVGILVQLKTLGRVTRVLV